MQRCWRVPRHYRCQKPARPKPDSATSKVTLTSSGTGLKWRAQLKHRTLANGRGAAPLTLQCSPGSTSSTSCPWCVVSCLPCVSQEAHAGTCHTSDATSTRVNNARDWVASLSEHVYACMAGQRLDVSRCVCSHHPARTACCWLLFRPISTSVGGARRTPNARMGARTPTTCATHVRAWPHSVLPKLCAPAACLPMPACIPRSNHPSPHWIDLRPAVCSCSQ